jgi:hypothetical protein
MGTGYRYGGLGHTGWVRNVNQFGSSGTYTVPSWAAAGTLFDIVAIGGGGGGQCPSASAFRNGGGGAHWNGAEPKYGTDVPLSTTTFGVTIGSGGIGGQSLGTNGANGASTTVTATGYTTLTATGGTGGGGPLDYGASPGNYTFGNTGYTGGAQQNTLGAAGNAPGGGGAAGQFSPSEPPGGNGAPGTVWVRAIDTTAGTGPFNSVAVYDNAVAGPATATVLTAESTTSTTATDLATTTDQVTVNVGPSGLVMVFLSAQLAVNTSTANCSASFVMSGANTSSAGLPYSIRFYAPATNAFGCYGQPFLLAGLSAGATTFKMKYYTNAGAATFSNRMISVIPL